MVESFLIAGMADDPAMMGIGASHLTLTSTILALLICTAAAALESALAGSSVRQRMAEFRMPAYSPPFAVWITIGVLYYAMCFIVLRELLNHTSFSPLHLTALGLLTTVLLSTHFGTCYFFAGVLCALVFLRSFLTSLLSLL